jgi:hypothetical protein
MEGLAGEQLFFSFGMLRASHEKISLVDQDYFFQE